MSDLNALYTQLAADLQSTKPKVAQAQGITVKKLIDDNPQKRMYEIHAGPLSGPYESKEVEALIGYVVSLITSITLFASTNLTASMATDDPEQNSLTKRLASYIENTPCEVTEHEQELMQTFNTVVQQSASGIMKDMVQDDDLELTGISTVSALISCVSTAYLLGRQQHKIPCEQSLLFETLFRIMAAAYRDNLLGTEEAKTAVLRTLDELFNNGLIQRLDAAEFDSPKALIEALKDYAQQQKQPGTGG